MTGNLEGRLVFDQGWRWFFAIPWRSRPQSMATSSTILNSIFNSKRIETWRPETHSVGPKSSEIKIFTKKGCRIFSSPWRHDQPSSIASSPSSFPNRFLAVLWWWWWWSSGEGYWRWSNDSVILHQLIDYTLGWIETAAWVGGGTYVSNLITEYGGSLFTDVHWKKRQGRKLGIFLP